MTFDQNMLTLLMAINEDKSLLEFAKEGTVVTRKDEIGRPQATLDRLRLSMLIAFKRKK
jgi:hypothetical protein